MLEVRYRIMDKADLPVITKIESDCQSHPWTQLQFIDGFSAGHEGWVAFKSFARKDMIIGFAIVSTVLDESTLLNICIRPAFQKKGYGRQLLEFLLDKARKQDIKNYFLEVRASNMTAIALYESAGFERISVRKDYYPALTGREDGLVYSLSSLSPLSGNP